MQSIQTLKHSKTRITADARSIDVIGISIAEEAFSFLIKESAMRTVLVSNLVAISIANKKLHAAECAECGAKMYPSSLLKQHLARHRLNQESFASELRQLQDTIERMRIA